MPSSLFTKEIPFNMVAGPDGFWFWSEGKVFESAWERGVIQAISRIHGNALELDIYDVGYYDENDLAEELVQYGAKHYLSHRKWNRKNQQQL